MTCKDAFPFRDSENNCSCIDGYMDGPNGDSCIEDVSGGSSEVGLLSPSLCMDRCDTCKSTTTCFTCKVATPARNVNDDCNCVTGYTDGPNGNSCIEQS